MTRAIEAAMFAVVGATAIAGVAGAQPDERAGRERPSEDAPTAPAPAPTPDPGSLIEPLAVVAFERGDAELADEDGRMLAATVRWMEAHPWRLVIIEGHADAVGRRDANMELSQRRADVVREELIRRGADPFRLVPAAFGEMEPAEDPTASRRVVVRGTLHTYEELIRAQRSLVPDPRARPDAGTPRAPRESS